MQSDYEKGLKKFLEFHGFKTYDYNLVETALTHSSYIYDRGLKYTACYERLEFLGDAVLKLITSEYLYRTFPEADEGKLTQIRSVIISDEVLAGIAMEINIADYIKMSESEARDGGREKHSILACAMEALLGAVYISGGYKDIETFVVKHMVGLIDDLIHNRSVYNAKTLLQEYTQSKSKVLPVYTTIRETGKSNNKTFFVEVSYNNEVLAEGSGKTKRSAQQEAAFLACKKLKIIE